MKARQKHAMVVFESSNHAFVLCVCTFSFQLIKRKRLKIKCKSLYLCVERDQMKINTRRLEVNKAIYGIYWLVNMLEVVKSFKWGQI